MVQYSNLDRVMEARDHLKNGAIPKNPISRRIFFGTWTKPFVMAFVIGIFALTGCGKGESFKNDDDDTITKILYVADFGTCGWGLMAMEGPPHPWTGQPTHSHTFFADNLPEIQDYYGSRILVTYCHTGKENSCFGNYPIINIIKILKQ